MRRCSVVLGHNSALAQRATAIITKGWIKWEGRIYAGSKSTVSILQIYYSPSIQSLMVLITISDHAINF